MATATFGLVSTTQTEQIYRKAEGTLAADNALYLVKVANSGGGTQKDQWVPAGHNKHRHRGSPAHVAEKEEAQLEVQSLLDRPVSVQTTSGVIGRIQESRRERHDKTVEDMKQELAVINAELEPRVQKTSELLKSQLAHNDKVIDALFARISSKDLLVHCSSLESLCVLWEEVASQSPVRQGYIRELEKSLREIEADRCRMVTEVLHGYAHMLQTIAYLLPNDVHRLIEEEAHNVNLSILANQRNYTQLCLHLTTNDFMREREQREKWEEAVFHWRELMLKTSLDDFKTQCTNHTESPDLDKLREWLGAEQNSVNRRREDLLHQLGTMRPPRANKSTVYEWNESVSKLHKQLEHIHSGYLLQFQSCQEGISRVCEEEMERYREHLVATGAYDPSSVYEVMNKHFLPVIEQHTTKSREELQNTEKSLDLLLTSQKAQFQALFQYAQGAAHTWDSHMATIAKLEREFQESLEKCRSLHDVDNQNLEANLDVVLDRLRQGASEEILKQYLEEALKMLDRIREGYVSFHSTTLSESQRFPSVMQQELDSYDSTLCKYFGVNRDPPKKQTLQKAQLSPSQSRADSRASKKTKTKRAKTTSSGLASNLSAIVEEVVSTSQGTSFYVHTSSREGGMGPGTFLTQDEESEGAILTFAMENIALSEQIFIKAKKGLRVSFLDHLERCRTEVTEKGREVVAGKEEEAHTELDLRLHLHNPRHSRVEQDIYNVRTAELLAHRDRVTRHVKGVVASLNDQKAMVQTLTEKQQMQADRFSEEMVSLESALLAASKTSGLQKVRVKAQEILGAHLKSISDISSCHQTSSEDTITSLASSNNSFRASLKLFSEGGNYCPEEVELFRKKMDKLATKIATTQTFVSGEVEAAIALQRAAAEEVMSTFEAQYQLHHMDLSFLEQITKTLTTTQVKIKAEVAASNTQARQLFAAVEQLQRMVEDCANPSPDREVVEAPAILAELPTLFQSVAARTDYLYCRASVYQGARVGFHLLEVSTPSVVMPQARSSGQGPISAVNVTRSILEHTSAGKKFGPEAELLLPAGRAQSRTVSSATGSQTSIDTRAGGSDEHQRRSGRQSRRKQPAIERKNISFGIGGGEEGSKSCFLPRIRAILKESHLKLYNMTEGYYRQKGSRAVMRPDKMHETFESCMDSLIERCHSYRLQAEEYRNDCIEEFHSQLDSVMSILTSVPPLVLEAVRERHHDKAKRTREEMSAAHQEEMENVAEEKASHESSLRPGLGHPSQREQLESLCDQEDNRHERAGKLTQTHAHSMRESERAHAKSFIEELVEATQSLISLFDCATYANEIIPGSGKLKTKLPVEQLLRDHLKPNQKTKDESSGQQRPTTGPGKGTWPGLPENDLTSVWEISIPTIETSETRSSLGSKTKKKSGTTCTLRESTCRTDSVLAAYAEQLSSQKATAAHEAVVRSRDGAFQEYVSSYMAELEAIKRREAAEKTSEEQWYNNWRASVDRVKGLFTE